MKNNILSSLFLFVFCYPPSFSQTIQFNTFSPKWMYLTETPKLSQTLRSSRVKDYLIDNDNFYILSDLINKAYEGHVVEKINLETGILNWRSVYYSDQVGKREYASNIYKDGLNRLNLLTIRNKKYGINWRDGWLEQRSLNQETGLMRMIIIL